ncbi:MAG: DUF3857 domain-containing protein [Winogradskyella sp.]|uniref:DUF3857 domain-containing transglutaminase family protein n=1 Tax=Winogradskyella sp. TaxID=1883156 RepID=UPI000F41AA7D|nr:DUF3857 domain-containing transglutaminase family protein [Winogradskyella sp.]RNC86230.1 MAG: DUF3857 domain-containing protein [Winogradskyella sp.]
MLKPIPALLKSFTILLFFTISYLSYSQLKTAPVPNWVVVQDYEEMPDIDENDIAFGLLTLLSDEQIHVPKRQQYIRYVKKITDNVGVQDGSLVSINYDPTYQKLVLHNVNILRNGKTINKLNLSDFQTIRKESNSENYIYDGSLNATANLSDVRSGDILDVSYTIQGFNPLHQKFSGAFILNDYQSVGKIHLNILSRNSLRYKLLNSDYKPKISNRFGLKNYSWVNTNTEPPEFEENTVAWQMMYQTLFVSEYDNWEQVVNWALPIYTQDSKFSDALNDKISTISKASEFESLRIKMALKFVQNEVRYLGLEAGIGAYKPFTPNKVFGQRFGDCKDKTWLLVNMLREMKVKAYPVLVNSTYGKSLNNVLPTPKAFDHVIVKVIDSTNNSYYYDPTIANQEGSYKDISLPNYGYGLVLKEGNTKLEAIEQESTDLVEIFDIYNVNGIGEDMTLNVTSVYRQGEADAIRSVLKSNSISSLNKQYRDYYKNFYEEVEILEAMIYEDDTIANKITIEESYKFNDVWTPMLGDESKIGISFTPYSLYNNIVFPTEKDRKTPFSLYYPIHKKHKITIKLPRAWGITSENEVVNSEHFEFSYKSKTNRPKDIIYLDYEFKNKSDHVPVDDFKEFYDDTKDMESMMSYYIFIPKSAAKFGSVFSTNKRSKSNNSNADSNEESSGVSAIIIGFLVFIFLIFIGLVLYIIRSNRKYN